MREGCALPHWRTSLAWNQCTDRRSSIFTITEFPWRTAGMECHTDDDSCRIENFNCLRTPELIWMATIRWAESGPRLLDLRQGALYIMSERRRFVPYARGHRSPSHPLPPEREPRRGVLLRESWPGRIRSCSSRIPMEPDSPRTGSRSTWHALSVARDLVHDMHSSRWPNDLRRTPHATLGGQSRAPRCRVPTEPVPMELVRTHWTGGSKRRRGDSAGSTLIERVPTRASSRTSSWRPQGPAGRLVVSVPAEVQIRAEFTLTNVVVPAAVGSSVGYEASTGRNGASDLVEVG